MEDTVINVSYTVDIAESISASSSADIYQSYGTTGSGVKYTKLTPTITESQWTSKDLNDKDFEEFNATTPHEVESETFEGVMGNLTDYSKLEEATTIAIKVTSGTQTNSIPLTKSATTETSITFTRNQTDLILYLEASGDYVVGDVVLKLSDTSAMTFYFNGIYYGKALRNEPEYLIEFDDPVELTENPQDIYTSNEEEVATLIANDSISVNFIVEGESFPISFTKDSTTTEAVTYIYGEASMTALSLYVSLTDYVFTLTTHEELWEEIEGSSISGIIKPVGAALQGFWKMYENQNLPSTFSSSQSFYFLGVLNYYHWVEDTTYSATGTAITGAGNKPTDQTTRVYANEGVHCYNSTDSKSWSSVYVSGVFQKVLPFDGYEQGIAVFAEDYTNMRVRAYCVTENASSQYVMMYGPKNSISIDFYATESSVTMKSGFYYLIYSDGLSKKYYTLNNENIIVNSAIKIYINNGNNFAVVSREEGKLNFIIDTAEDVPCKIEILETPDVEGLVSLFNSYKDTENPVDKLYPVGTIYITKDSDFDPEETFGGEWGTLGTQYLFNTFLYYYKREG